MTAHGVEYLQEWMIRTITVETTSADAGGLTAHLLAEAAAAGFTLADLELDQETAETYIREAIVHVAEPGMPGD